MPVITINIDTSSLQGGFERLLRLTQNLLPVMDEIGLYMAEETQERFRTNISPEGQAWKPSLRAEQDGGKTLLDRGHLRDSITHLPSANSVAIGTNMVYAAIHQFGGKTSPHKIEAKRAKALHFGGLFFKSVNHPGSDMPARPYLGFSADDELAVTDIIETHIEVALR